MNYREQVKYANELHVNVRAIVARTLRPVLDAVPVERKEEREVTEGRYGSACEFIASVVSLFAAYRSLVVGAPNSAALLRALNDLAFGFETNQFYATFRGYLHPILMNSINTWIDSVEYVLEQQTQDSQTVRFMVFATQNSWLEVCSAAAFCFGGAAFAREHSKQLRDEIYKVV